MIVTAKKSDGTVGKALDLLDKVASKMMGKTICALSDAAAMPTRSFVQKFRDEFEFYVREGRSKIKGNLHAQM